MTRSILLASLVLATACMTGPYDGQVVSPGSSITFSGYLERPNEPVQIFVVRPNGDETLVASTTSSSNSVQFDGTNWYNWRTSYTPPVSLWRSEGRAGRRLHVRARARRAGTSTWYDLYSFRESIFAPTSQCYVLTNGRTVSDLQKCLSTVNPIARLQDSAFSSCGTSDYTCNGRDEDCDGRVDEGYSTASNTCGVGACRATGTRSCSNGTVVSSCVPRPATGDDTDCDGIDDDCDGRTDEHFVVTQVSCGSGLGVCAQPGTRRCVSGSITTTCEPGGTASDESCNGLDDDCDGATDESHSACGEDQCVATTACEGGVAQCRPKADDDNCDGFDDDCDGMVDEHRDDTDATCDGFDDDCDGSLDEDFPDLNPCATETCVAGRIQSAPAIPSSMCPATPSPTETRPPGAFPPFAETVGYLFGRPGSYQRDVAAGAIRGETAARIFGEVRSTSGGAMGGVRVEIDGHPELGFAMSRADGRWDLVVNGGARLVVTFSRALHPRVDRYVVPLIGEHTHVDDVVLTPYDGASSRLEFGPGGTSAPIVHRATEVTDDDGTRRATVFVPSGTRASIVGSDGNVEALTSGTLRATEYTVGSRGPDAMPAPMPTPIAYTYALELSLDEAGPSDRVQFNQPVSFYVENFLGYSPPNPANGDVVPVPIGYYDRLTHRWVPSEDGVVLFLRTAVDGRAQIDLNNDGRAEGAEVLLALGIDDEELRSLAVTYPAATNAAPVSLWRTQLEHLTPWDCNWPYDLPDDAGFPPPPEPDDEPQPEDDPTECPGTILQCENRTIAEEVPIAGTGLSLRYQSDRVRAYRDARRLTLPVSAEPPSPSRVEAVVNITVGGRSFSYAGPFETDDAGGEFLEFTDWDGTDWNGSAIDRPVRLQAEICYRYRAVPTVSVLRNVDRIASGSGRSFGARGSVAVQTTVSASRSAGVADLCSSTTERIEIGMLDAQRVHGLGGLSLSHRHVLAGGHASVHLGTGRTERVQTNAARVATVFGRNPAAAGCRDGSSACGYAADIAVDSQGHVLVYADVIHPPFAYPGIYRVQQSGEVERLMSIMYPMYLPIQMEVNGSDEVYVSMVEGEVVAIFRVMPDGRMIHFAGNTSGRRDFCGEIVPGQPATEVALGNVQDFTFDRDGTMYVVSGCRRVVAVQPDGAASVVADLDDAISRMATHPRGLLLMGADGLRLLNHDGDFERVTSSSIDDMRLAEGAEGHFASDVFVPSMTDVVGTSDGWVAFNHRSSDEGGEQVWGIDPRGRLHLLAGGGAREPPFAEVDGRDARLRRGGAAVAGGRCLVAGLFGGEIYRRSSWSPVAFGDAIERIRRRPLLSVGSSLLGESSGRAVPTSEGLALFDEWERHFATADPYSGVSTLAFGYDDESRIESITDASGNAVSVRYSDTDVRFTTPGGVTTVVELDDGWASAVRYEPDTHISTVRFDYDESPEWAGLGRLRRVTDREGMRHEIVFDDLGRVESDEMRTADGETVLARWDVTAFDPAWVADGQRRAVAVDSTSGRRTVYRTEVREDGVLWSEVEYPGGLRVISEDDGRTVTTTTPDGAVSRSVRSSSPITEDDYVGREELVLPSLREVVRTQQRTAQLSSLGQLESLDVTSSSTGGLIRESYVRIADPALPYDTTGLPRARFHRDHRAPHARVGKVRRRARVGDDLAERVGEGAEFSSPSLDRPRRAQVRARSTS